VVDLSLPTISSELRDKQRKQQQGSSSSSSSSDSGSELGSESDSEGDEQQAGSKPQAAAAEVDKPYEGRDSSGAPAPLAPQLVTLSLLPRAQVENLVALDLIKARNKPIAPPKKPAAAPFFLPTKATLERNPVFDLDAAQREEQEAPSGSRLLTGAGSSAAQSTFLRLLRAGSDSKDYSSFMAHLRELGPAAVDMELRGMQLLEGCTDEEVRDVAALLEALDQQLAGGTNFEFCQAVLQAALAVHGEAVMEQPLLRGAAQRLKTRLRGDWQRLDELLQGVRCMVDFFGNLQM
jgi:U3 small nucleolar RNA-associated protein 21